MVTLKLLGGMSLEDESGPLTDQVVQRRRANEERSKQMQPDQAKPAKTQSVPRENARFSRDKGKPRGRKGGKPAEADAAEEGSGKPNAKEDMKQKLIARKRLMRKKKAQIRGKK